MLIKLQKFIKSEAIIKYFSRYKFAQNVNMWFSKLRFLITVLYTNV